MLYILIIIISAIAQYLGPWWTMPLVCFVLCFWKSESPKQAALVASSAIATLWLGYALYQHHISEGVITNKIADIFRIPNAALLFTAVTLVGSLVAGLAGTAGNYCRQAIAKN